MKRFLNILCALLFMLHANFVTAAMLAPLPPVRAEFMQNGNPCSGCKVYFFEPSTTTPKNTYSDALGAVPNANPVVLDSQGRATIFISGFYRVKVTTALGTELYTTDNVSASPSQTVVVSEWITAGVTPTYISAVSFSVPGDYTGTFEVGRRVKATVSAGLVYGTIITSSYGTGVTTVTVVNDSGALDAGLASVDTGILSLTNKALPVEPVVTKTDDYVMTAADVNKQFIFNKGTAVATTLKAATTIPNGTRLKFRNIGAGTLTLTGTVILSGTSTVNPTLVQYAEAEIWSNGTSWYGVIWSATLTVNSVPVRDATGNIGGGPGIIGEATVKTTDIATSPTIDMGTVTAGDRIDVSAMTSLTPSISGTISLTVGKSAGSATIAFYEDNASMSDIHNVAGGAPYAFSARGVCKVTGSGTLTLQLSNSYGGTPTVVNKQMSVFFIKKQ
jgi:hypothetical protein